MFDEQEDNNIIRIGMQGNSMIGVIKLKQPSGWLEKNFKFTSMETMVRYANTMGMSTYGEDINFVLSALAPLASYL